MYEPKQRLIAAREAAGFSSPAEVARHFKHINQNTLTSNENGNREISKKMASVYAEAFNVSAGWLLYGEESAVDFLSFLKVPLIASVSAGILREPTQTDIEKTISTTDMPPGDYFALRVDGDSMNRIAVDGSIIIVDRSSKILKDRGFYIFEHEAEGTFKRYRTDPMSLEPYSTNPEHRAIIPENEPVPVGEVKRVITDL